MYRLPIFPLNTVLFPGMPLNLHIFEERYKHMIRRCIDQREAFGVVLIQHGAEANGPLPRPHAVGCTARISKMERLPEGRMVISAIGDERFRIHRLSRSADAYMLATVETYPMAEAAHLPLEQAVDPLRIWVARYLHELALAGKTDKRAYRMPDDATTFIYLAATLLQVPAEQKQPVLESSCLVGAARNLTAMYRREFALLEALLHEPGKHNAPFN